MFSSKIKLKSDLIYLIVILFSFVFYDLFFIGKFFGSFVLYLLLAVFIFLLVSRKKKTKIEIPKKELVYPTIILILVLFLFIRSSIFDFSGPIVMTDNPFYFYKSEIMFKHILEGNTGTSYHSFDFWDAKHNLVGFGFEEQSFLIGFYSFVFNLDLVAVFRLFVLFSFLIAVFGFYHFTKLKFGTSTAFFVSVLFVSFTNHQFTTGQVSMYLGIGVSLFIFYFHDRLKRRNLIVPLLFMNLAWIHLVIFLLTLTVFLIYSIVGKKQYWKGAALFLISIAFFYVLGNIHGLLHSLFSGESLFVVYMPHLMSTYEIFFNFYFKNSFAVFVLGFLGLISSRKSKWFFILAVLFSLLIANQFLINYPLQIYISFYIRTLFCFFAGFLIFRFLNEKKNKVLTSLIISIFLVDVLFYQSYLFQVWQDTNNPFFEYINIGTFYEWEKLNLTNGIFSFELNPHFSDVVEFINSQSSGDYRVLVEDSLYREWGGYVTGLLDVYTDGMFVTGPYITTVPTEFFSYDSVIFGENISDYTIQEFNGKLDKFNVKYLVAWTEEFKIFLNRESLLL